ncbi:hypothetical protein FOXG_21990 [Fusarium oxysporum f. sp. lycopersici 4287]|uniref:Vegetative incompatibility protein HET-E-1 n=2 Tax=Fusarium oxysporum TaxID=5507 RepID=A0A0J9W3Z8_FUSO4|nr:hypothetical protein FOXG_21990 [Fusarium oxysporum f. sp. lycopersici 4287]KNB17625.1 hypothetical protein FOXG_21990 [Fusarium oxysporum f. sp. lycopersici 4287]
MEGQCCMQKALDLLAESRRETKRLQEALREQMEMTKELKEAVAKQEETVREMGKQMVEIKDQMTEELQRVREQLETIVTNAMDGPQRSYADVTRLTPFLPHNDSRTLAAPPNPTDVLYCTIDDHLQGREREGIQGGLDSLLQGKVPITFTGHFGAGPAVSLAPAPAPSAAPTLNFNAAPAPAPEPPVPGMPVVAALAKVFTVLDVWKEWEEGIAGQPAVRVLEETWGSRWRPGNGIRVQFCRRKVIWDELLARTASGKSEEEAVAELELLRAGWSLNRLVDELKQRRRRGQGRLRVQLLEWFAKTKFPGVKNMRCLKHLYVTDPRDDKQRILETKGGLLKGSYCWILKNDRFQRFRDDPQSPLLWIKGDLGKGKTMLLCGIIDELEKESAKRLSYFFCQATEAQLSSATGVLRGLIYLLIIQQPSLIS